MSTWVLGKPVKHWALQADRGVVGMPSKDCVGRFENLSHNPLPGSGSFLLRWESAQHLWVEMQNAGRTARVSFGVGLGRSWAVLVVGSAPCELFEQPQAHTRDMLSNSLDMEAFPYVLGASCLRHCCAACLQSKLSWWMPVESMYEPECTQTKNMAKLGI